jgi:catechol 2,3-dioxygenase-like lactoylglutathione lyase family enzyme
MKVTGIHHVTLLVDDLERAEWFYGEVLGLQEKGRPEFDFRGLFYWAGDGQEIHLIEAESPLDDDRPIYFRRGNGTKMTLRHVHRHAALRVSELPCYERRLIDAGIEILFSEAVSDQDDDMTKNMMAGWRAAYKQLPLFFKDPFGNLIELVPMG